MKTYRAVSRAFGWSVIERVLTEERLRWKLGCSVVLLLASLTLLVYTATGLPWPRPWYLFVIVAVLVTLLGFHIPWVGNSHIVGTWFSLASLTLVSWILRWTSLARPTNTMGDHEGFLRMMMALAETNSIPAGGVYEFTPFIFELPQLWRFVAGATLFETVIVTNATSSLLPVAVFLFLREARNARTGWVGAVLSVPFGLFLRSSVLVETPSIALLWFVLCFYLLSKVEQNYDKRLAALLIGFVLISTWIHPYYSLVTGVLVFGVLLLRVVEYRLTGLPNRYLPLVGVTAALALVIFRSQPVWRLAVAGASSFNPGVLLQDPIGALYPTGGAIGRSLGQTGSSGGTVVDGLNPLLRNALKLYQMAILGVAAVLGGVYSLIARERFLSYVGFLSAGFPFLLLLRQTQQAKYRGYYIIGVAMVIFAALLFSQLWEERDRLNPQSRNLLLVIVLALIFSYALLGPVSSIGNDMDPKIQGSSGVLLPSDYEQLSALNNRMDDVNVVRIHAEFDKRVVAGSNRRLFRTPNNENGLKVTVRRECSETNALWDSGRFCAGTV